MREARHTGGKRVIDDGRELCQGDLEGRNRSPKRRLEVGPECQLAGIRPLESTGDLVLLPLLKATFLID